MRQRYCRVAQNGTLSEPVKIDGMLLSVELPNLFSGTTLKIHTSLDGENYQPFMKEGAVVSETVAAGRNIGLLQHQIICSFIKLEVASQAAARDIKVNALPV
jgi:hypothetical protein